MIQLLRKILDKFETPANDWVLSRFGGCEAPDLAPESRAAGHVADQQDEQSPLGHGPPFDHWLDEADSLDGVPPQSGEVVSLNVSAQQAEPRTKERKSRAG